MQYYLGVDLGGTNIVAGLVDRDANILIQETLRTNLPRPAEEICADIETLCRAVPEKAGVPLSDLPWVGIGSPGIIHDNVILYANNLEFRDVAMADILERRLGRKVYLANDGNAAAYGEFIAGAGKGHRSMVEVTLGTGVGGGIITGGKIHSGFNGAAGELGHMVVAANGRLCTCGKRGCLEAYCSATALKSMTREAMDANPDSLLHPLAEEAGRVSAKLAFAAARQGDKAGRAVVDAFLYHLSLGISNVVNLLQPEVICIGGGVSREGEAILAPLRAMVAEQTYLEEEYRPKIVPSMLGGNAGLIGAALQGLQEAERHAVV